MNKLSVICNADTRAGWLDGDSHVGKTGEGSLHGVRSQEFLTALPTTIKNFFAGWDGEVEIVMCVDVHEALPLWMPAELATMHPGVRWVMREHDHKRKQYWNDRLYLRALREGANADYIAHVDQDVAMFRNPDFDAPNWMKGQLDSGAFKFVCQPTMVADHGMLFPSTRFFICKRETLDFDELDRAIDRTYRISKYGDKHCACLEQVIGLVSAKNQGILYPPYWQKEWVCFSWVKYRAGLLPALNGMSYVDVQQFINQGALCGPMDFIPPPFA